MSSHQDNNDFLPLKSSGLGKSVESFDPEDNATVTISHEAKQAHFFRKLAFGGAFIADMAIGILWWGLLFCSPENSAPTAAFHLWMVKCSLSTVAFIVVTTSLLNFAIKCYGHHNNQKEADLKSNDSLVQIIGKAIEQAGKSISNN